MIIKRVKSMTIKTTGVTRKLEWRVTSEQPRQRHCVPTGERKEHVITPRPPMPSRKI